MVFILKSNLIHLEMTHFLSYYLVVFCFVLFSPF